jgi:hypothetical protein
MSFLDDLLGSLLQLAGVNVPQRKTINFASGFTVDDDPANDRTNITSISAAGVTPYAGTNPNTDNVPGSRGDILRNTGAWNGFSSWVAMLSGTPASWVVDGRAGNITSVAASYQVTNLDWKIFVTSTAAQRTITLPNVTTIATGFDLEVFDMSLSATGNNTLIVGHAGELIDGNASFTPNPGTPGIPADGNGNSFNFLWNGTIWSAQ